MGGFWNPERYRTSIPCVLIICWINIFYLYFKVLFFKLFPSGVKAEDIPTMHYRLKNDSLCLHAHIPANSDATWLFYKKVIVRKNKVTSNFIDRVDYNSHNLSLCINRLSEQDSGLYSISFFESDEVQTYNYRLQVQGKCFLSSQSVLDYNPSSTETLYFSSYLCRYQAFRKPFKSVFMITNVLFP